jgi:2-keto-3-deoxy-L-rhamnonate aldolase RhmA
MDSPETCELAAAAGFDFVIIDMEHGTFDVSSMVGMVRAVEARGATPVVRVPVNETSIIKRTLDAGASIVIVPGITSVEDARRAIAATRYEPFGSRGSCPVSRSTEHGLKPWDDVVRAAHEDVAVWLLIEHPGAVAAIEDILALEPDGIMLGPFDLSMSMGLQGDSGHPEVRAALKTVVQAASAVGIDSVAVTVDDNPADGAHAAASWYEDGCTMSTVLIDRLTLAAAYRHALHAIHNIH